MKRSNTTFVLGSLRYLRLFLICMGMFVLSIVIVNTIAPYRVYGDTPKRLKEEGHLIQDTKLEYTGFQQLVLDYPKDVKLKVEYIDFLSQIKYTGDLYELKERIKASHTQSVLVGEYVDINDPIDAMIVAYTEYKLKHPEVAILYLDKFKNDTVHYNCQLTTGVLYQFIDNYTDAEEAYLSEINNEEGNKNSALKSLANLYALQRRYAAISGLSKKYDYWLRNIPLNLSIRVSRATSDVVLYLRGVWSYISSGLNSWGIAGALIITMAYFIFLYRIDVFRREPIVSLVMTLLLGCLSPVLVFYLSDVLSEYTNVEYNVITKYVIQVGLVEEIVKLIPFLIILFGTKLIQEPYDFILYISLSALGFALTENLIYFDVNNVGLIQIRALTGVIGHMVDSSIIAYTIVYFKFKMGKRGVFIPLCLGLVLASVSHGLYDILAVQNLTPLFVLFFLYLIFNWGIMLNNTLNNSPYFELKKVKKIESFRVWMGVVLLFVLLSEYVLRAFQLGSFWANDMMFGAFFFIFYLWLYISLSIGGLDFFRGYWEPIGYSENIKAIIFPRMANHRVYLGNNVVIRPVKGDNPNSIYELRGQLVSRRIVRGDKDWYVLKLKEKLNAPGFYNNIALVWFQDYDASIQEDKDIRVKVHLIKEIVDLKQIKIRETNILLKGDLNGC